MDKFNLKMVSEIQELMVMAKEIENIKKDTTDADYRKELKIELSALLALIKTDVEVLNGIIQREEQSYWEANKKEINMDVWERKYDQFREKVK